MNESQIELVPAKGDVKLHHNTIDLRKKRFGSLTVESITDQRCGIGGQKKWRCRCDCGRIVLANQTQLNEQRITICQSCVDDAVAVHIEREKDAINKVKVGGVKALPSKAFLDECFSYDAGTGVLTWKHRPMSHFASEMVWNMWLAHYAGTEAGRPADRRDGKPHAIFVKISIGEHNLSFLAHRIIGAMMGIVIPEGMQIDHADRNPWNNKFLNLRVATQAQNLVNQAKRKTKRGLLKGASRCKSGRFQALIGINGTQRHLGMFDTEQEAHEAYCAKAREIHGEFFCPG